MMTWIVGNILLWNIFLIVFLAVAIITATRKCDHELAESTGIVSLRLILHIFALGTYLVSLTIEENTTVQH